MGKKLLAWWERWERTLSVIFLIGGFSFDLIIAKRPDSLYDNLLLLSYLATSAGCIILLNARARRTSEASSKAEPLATLLILQFCFGGLASNLLVLYGHSGTLSGNVLFFGILGGMLVGNEFLRNRYSQLRFNLAIYTALLLAYLLISVPTFVLHTIGIRTFFISLAIGAGVMALFIFLLSGSARLFRGNAGHKRMVESSLIVGAVFAAQAVLYFSNIIPPVPLSLKAIGIYHTLAHPDTGGYDVTYEPAPWWEFWAGTSGTYHTTLGGRAYCFAAIFAPTGLTAPVVHHWEWYDPQAGKWETEAKVSFPITGGRAGGYYGYSYQGLFMFGRWRCNVETINGDLIGRTSFTAVEGTTTLETENI